MTKVISAFEAPALLDAHPTITRHALYEALIGAPRSIGRAGISYHLADGALRFAEEEYGWKTPVTKTFSGDAIGGLVPTARVTMTSDAEGELAVVFVHLADYLYRATWGKAGTPPEPFVIQANWAMWLSNTKRMAFLVLADKRIVLYELQRDEALVAKLSVAVSEMAKAVENRNPPPIDATPQALPTEAKQDDGSSSAEPADLDELVQRFRNAREAKSMTANSATFAEQASDAASDALKNALPKGAHHDFDGVRTYHNAKTGRLTEEKIDASYF